MPPDRRTNTMREDIARLSANQEAVNERATSAVKAAQQIAMDLHRVMENVQLEVRGVGDRMATAEQVRRLEDRVTEVDRRVMEHAPAVGVVPGLVAKVEALEKAAARVDALEKTAARVDALEKKALVHDKTAEDLPVVTERVDAQEHRHSRMGGALWAVGVAVGLLGLAGLRDCSRWFVEPTPHTQRQSVEPDDPRPTPRRRQ
ncbi:hypothetical protein G4177_06200 [Corallococcus sp. ZKHCc1 1396]|uniref:DUF3618 domain-containing protein n=1 Tax=Corallococcus soli TaxID=2710757 RepID=A0ABR9PIN9_9BACT|nr:hypothetical protein [Corallococcus soli]MBE4747769.1 hypothetical protein [Corallococcus soli]